MTTCAPLAGPQVAGIDAVDRDVSVIGESQAEQQLQQRALAGAAAPANGDSFTGFDLEGRGAEPAPAGRKLVRDAVNGDGGGAFGGAVQNAPLILRRQVEQRSQLVDRRQQIVKALHVLAELGERADDDRHDQLGGDKLAQRQLARDDQPASQSQQHRAHDRLHRDGEDHLTHEHAKVPPPGAEVFVDVVVGALQGELRPAAESKGVAAPPEVLQPARRLVFPLRLVDRGADGASPQHEDDDRQHDQEKHVEPQQPGVIERQHRHADQHRQHKRNALEQQLGRRLLHGDHVEEAVGQLGKVLAVGRFPPDARQPVGQVRRDPREQAALNDLHHPRLQHLQRGREREERQQDQRQHDDRLQIAPEGHRAHQRFHGDRRGQRQHAGQKRIDAHRVNVAPLGPGQRGEPAQRGHRRRAIFGLVRDASRHHDHAAEDALAGGIAEALPELRGALPPRGLAARRPHNTQSAAPRAVDRAPRALRFAPISDQPRPLPHHLHELVEAAVHNARLQAEAAA